MGANRAIFIFISIQLVSLVTAQEMTKRVPQGFLGMRGKKQLDEESLEQFYKRKPQFFVGVKGKKSLQDMLDSREEYFRNSRALRMALSGNKDSFPDSAETTEYVPKRDGSWIGQIDYSTSGDGFNLLENFPILHELLSQYLQRFQRPSISNFDPEVEADMEPMSSEQVTKRAANIHQFFGVRGKKSLNNKRPYDLSFRGKFIGVRGKKDVKNSGTHEIKFLLENPLPKRKSQMGFFGMRGKKWSVPEEPSQEIETPN